MISILLEQPLTIAVVGVVVAACFAGGLATTGRGWMLVGLVLTLVTTLVLVAVERWVVTEREAVEDTLHAVAAAVATNEVDRVLDYVSPSAAETRADIARIMPQAFVESLSVGGNLEIAVRERHDPPLAEAMFSGVIRGHWRREPGLHRPWPVQFLVRLRKEGDRWLVASYELTNEGEALRGFRRRLAPQ